jgi:hypothetical protein
MDVLFVICAYDIPYDCYPSIYSIYTVLSGVCMLVAI